MNQNDGAILKQQRDGEQYGDIFRNKQDVSMTKTALDHLRDERHNFYGESHNPVSSHLFSVDMGPPSNSSTDAAHHNFSTTHNDNGNLRLSMPAPKRTLPSSIVDSLNEDSLFFSGGQPSIFGSGLASPYLHSDTPVLISQSQSNFYVHGGDQADNDSDFDDRGPRSFSLGEDTYPTTSSIPTSDYLFNRPASTPVSASFATSSSQMMHYQNSQSQSQSVQLGNQNQINKMFPQRQKYGQSTSIEAGIYNSMLPPHLEQDSSYHRTALSQQQQQQQGYLQHPPSNLQLHLADIDRRMEIRRGKSAGPGTGPYDGGGSSSQISGGENMLGSNGIRQSQQQQLQHQQLVFLNGRNGTSNTTPVRSQGLMDAMMIQQQQQRPASTPLPMSMPHNHMHHLQQQQQPSLEHSHKPHGPPLLNLCGLEDASVEDIVAKSCRDILIEAASHSLKAVELANTLRARVGTEVLAHIRERWGGLLSLLERHTHIFRVERIPKNDLVTLVNGGGVTSVTTHPPPGGSQATALTRSGSRMSSSSGFTVQSQIQGEQHGLAQGSFYNNSGVQLHSASAPPTLALTQGLHRTLSPPATSSGIGQYGQHYSSGNTAGGEYVVMNGGAGGSGEGTVSRCLHVGNVPANMTETQLLRELERYGDVDCLKLVSQRSRRFAFVSFRTVEQAISAKQRMTRVHPWKSAISFAHKESQSMTMTMTQPIPGSAGSPAPYGFPDQHLQQQQPQMQQQQQYYGNNNVVASSLTSLANQNQNHLQGNQIYQHQQQQQQQHAVLTSSGISLSNVLNHQTLTALQHQKQQQDEEEELNQLFTRSISVAPMAPIPSNTRYNMDSVFGANSSTALDAMVNNSSFAPGAGMGIIRPASTGSVNLDGNCNLFNSSFPAPNPFPSSTGHVIPMAMPRPRELITSHYGPYDFQDSSTAPGSLNGQNMMGGVASIPRGVMGSPGPLAVRPPPMGLQSPRPPTEDINLGLDLDYDYELLLSGNPPLNAAERDRERATMSLSTSIDPSSVLAQPSSSSGGISGVDYVLRRLCDDTYVPTQPWPVRWEVDAFYCSAVVAQLQQFGGVTTISKLRGFLRSRVNATDNIKSVPLKAMLSGYPGFFTVRSNQVTLGPDPLFSIPGGMDTSANMNTGMSSNVGAAVNIFPSGTNRGNLDIFSQGGGGGSDFDLRSGSGSGLSPGTSPPSPSFGYGMQ